MSLMPHPPIIGSRLAAPGFRKTAPDPLVARGLLSAARGIALACVIALVLPTRTAAQDTRAGAIAAEQADKATRLAPRVPSAAERAFEAAKRTLLEEPSGFYPYFGSVYSGGGFTLGAGYRQFTGDRAHWNVAGLYSAKGYKLIEGSAVSPGHFAGRLDLQSRIGWRDATQVPYHGLGLDSPQDAASAFRMQQTYVGGDVIGRARAVVRPCGRDL